MACPFRYPGKWLLSVLISNLKNCLWKRTILICRLDIELNVIIPRCLLELSGNPVQRGKAGQQRRINPQN